MTEWCLNCAPVTVTGPLTSQNIMFVLLGRSVSMMSRKKIWITRRLLESLLEQNPYVVCFFSCITTFSEGKHEKKNRRSNKDSSSSSKDETVSEQNFYPGMSLWIVFILPEYGLVAFEECISKEI